MFSQISWIRTGKVALIAFLFARIEVKSHSLHLMTFPHCLISNVYSINLDQKRQSRINCISSLFSTVYFQMPPQIVYPNRGKVTFFAFIWFFPNVWFQMFTQITSIWTGKVALIAFLFARIELKSYSLHLFDFSGKQFEERFENTQWRKVQKMQSMRLCLFWSKLFE